MIRLVWRTDVHMADRNPSSRTDNWPETVLGKLGQVRDLAEKVGAQAILDGGDFFHVKAPSRNSHDLVESVARHHADYPCPVYCTPGNHDSVYGDYAFLGQQPLGVLFATGVFKKLYDLEEAGFIDENGLMVRVVGIPYHGSTYDMSRFTDIERKGEDILICVAHVLASEDGGSMFEGEDIIRYSDLLDTAPDVFLFGHWHKDQGVVELGGKTFVNIGSLTRGALSQDEVQRQPACAVLSVTGQGSALSPLCRVEVEVVRLKVRPAEEVFDVEKRARQVREQVEMDAFVEKIRASLEPAKDSVSLTETVKAMQDVPGDIRALAVSYLELVE